jgi:predicted anti-sigma-YlaC factor YlaD
MTNSNDRLNCRESLDWLQRRLDGAGLGMPASVAEHARDCADCRGRIQAANQLFAGLGTRSARYMPTPPMTERIIRAVERDRRQLRLRRWAAVGTALAAAIVLAVWLSNAGHRNTGSPAMSLRQSAADAGEAVVAISKRAVNETVGESRLLVPQLEMPKIVNSSLALATAPIENTGRNMADGLAPVANSARRAVNLFFR